MKVKAAVLREHCKSRPYSRMLPLTIEEVELDPPKDREVLVKIKAAGLCHSDLFALNGERPKPTPMILGHEAAGIVCELGPNVKNFRNGDHVVISFVSSCGCCSMCNEGRPALCMPATAANNAGTLIDGTTRFHQNGERIFHHSGVAAFSEYTVISENALIKINSDIPFDVAALFGCAVVTGVGAVVNTAQVSPGHTVAIVGLGGVGLNALLAAVSVGAGKIIAVDLKDHKLKIAKKFGANHVFYANNPHCIDDIIDVTDGGVDFAFETAGCSKALDLAYNITRRGGHTIVAGMPGPQEEIKFSHLSLTANERTIKGSYMGSCIPSRDIPRYLRLYQNDCLPVNEIICNYIDFNGLNAAFDRLDSGESLRQVLLL